MLVITRKIGQKVFIGDYTLLVTGIVGNVAYVFQTKKNETIGIGYDINYYPSHPMKITDDIEFVVIANLGGKLRIGINAPKTVIIAREELITDGHPFDRKVK